MFDSLFAFFFKYSPYVFQQGELRLAFGSPIYIAVGLAAVAALATVVTYRSAPGEASWIDRSVLIGLRLCLVALVLFCLFRPVLILRAAVPQQNFLGILLDDSRSALRRPRIQHIREDLRACVRQQDSASPSASRW